MTDKKVSAPVGARNVLRWARGAVGCRDRHNLYSKLTGINVPAAHGAAGELIATDRRRRSAVILFGNSFIGGRRPFVTKIRHYAY